MLMHRGIHLHIERRIHAVDILLIQFLAQKLHSLTEAYTYK